MASTVLLVVVFVLDLIAFGLAIAAEQRRATMITQLGKSLSLFKKIGIQTKDIATGLGVGSFLFLLASQLLIMLASRCLCCGRALRPGKSRAWAIVLFITCWVTFFIAEVCLLAASVRNAYHTKYKTYLAQHSPSCEVLRKGVFGAGAAFIVFTGIVSELFYVSYSKADEGSIPPRMDGGIRMNAFR